MPQFSYFTRGNSSPQGKTRVYFTAHPTNQENCLKRYKDYILKRQDCALYYIESELTQEEIADYEADLSGMQIFVIPVTYMLLTTPCRTIDFDLPFAISHHIPLLPIMEESGLEELYQKHFGDLQYLDLNSRDKTGISFEDKLDGFLEKNIIGDELANKIRAAFDAYIFLSYRKKDRIHAQKLMRLIHKNDFCRDIAIWYDEFLVPGEDFNHAILEALEKSSLFALTVTPNLVNEENYVHSIEYPLALDFGKKILPVEMIRTDHMKLSEMYKGFPNPVTPEEGECLKSLLEDSLKRIAADTENSDPQHVFFIGLAYLAGIDVEVDHEKAVNLIQSAAENGLPEAAEKLVSMYQNGNGVERSFSTSESWLRKYVELLEYRQKTEPDAENAMDLLNALRDLGDLIQYTLNRFTEGEDILEKGLCYARDFSETYRTDEFQNALSVSCERYGSYLLRTCYRVSTDGKAATGPHGESTEQMIQHAEKLYLESLAINESLVEKSSEPAYRRNIAVMYRKLADSSGKQRKYDLKKAYLYKALALCESLAEEPGSLYDLKNLCSAYQALGTYEKGIYAPDPPDDWFKGHRCKGIEWYLKSYQILERIAEDTGDRSSRVNLANAYMQLAQMDAMPWNVRCYEKEQSIWKALHEEYPDISNYKARMNHAASSISFVKKRLWDEEPESKIQKFELQEMILKHPDHPLAQFIRKLYTEE